MKNNELMEEIVDKKYDELSQTLNKNDRYWKVWTFEGNSVGQIGELFIKRKFYLLNIPIENENPNVHADYDVLTSKNKIKIEVKTARMGRNLSFQFNGINPLYEFEYIIVIGLTGNDILYRVIHKRELEHDRNWNFYYVSDDNIKIKLTKMNPNNNVNYKLTLRKHQLKNIDLLDDELQALLSTEIGN